VRPAPWQRPPAPGRLRGLPSPLAHSAGPHTRLQVEKELSEICASILQLLDEHLIPTASSGESKVFYLKMKVRRGARGGGRGRGRSAQRRGGRLAQQPQQPQQPD
jgi:hypothetical protein